MGTTNASLRNLIRMAFDDEMDYAPKPFQSTLEKYARAARYGYESVQYYSRRYPYPEVVTERDFETYTTKFSDNVFGK